MSDIKGCQQAAESLYERFEFRYIRPEEETRQHGSNRSAFRQMKHVRRK